MSIRGKVCYHQKAAGTPAAFLFWTINLFKGGYNEKNWPFPERNA